MKARSLSCGIATVILALAEASSAGEIYRAVRPDGSVAFSDRPIPGGRLVGRNDRGGWSADTPARRDFADAVDALARARVVQPGETLVPAGSGRPARLAPEYYKRVRQAEARLAGAHARVTAERTGTVVARW